MHSLTSFLLNCCFPPHCPLCREPISKHGSLCGTCWQQVRFISDPLCTCCGRPFEYDQGDQARCGKCLASPPLYARARAAFCYGDGSKKLITRLKYNDKTQLLPVLGNWLNQAASPFYGETDYIIPVPLHYRRLLKRRYNQSALLANELNRHSSLPVLANALKRLRNTPTQTGLSQKEREANVRNAFTVHPRLAAKLKGKTVLLVDDVHTTGATLNACTKALHQCGVIRVNSVTLSCTSYD